jgi:hypothetical protein
VKQLFVNVAASLVVLTSGTNTLEATPEHPLWVADQGWKAAGQVQVGDELWTREGQRLEVTGITHKQGRFTVFNFEVEDFHTYFVGGDGVLGHNKCQIHHLIPWENSYWKHHEHDLVKLAGLSQKDLKNYARNLMDLEHHAGPPSFDYHAEIRRRMDDAYSNLPSRSKQNALDALDQAISEVAGDIAAGRLKPYNTKEVYVP